ncbi:E3 ubiquitin-protein ligase TRIM39-like [Pleurodeles waltl]|uniref:E3 ubiquitin-protein ligase TRIM39-like n=1 Tax=Pleurodeles waltl TaxID=8319 RepID=UPI003709BD7D
MAAAQLTGLRDEATCSICLEYFTDPVSTDCGHVFCRSCITQSWEGRDGNSPCPQCREISPGRSLRPIRQLGNMVEMVKQLHLPPVKPPEGNLCEKHEEKLRLFCEEDQTLICVVCDRSKEHRSHSVSPIEEAAQEYKVKLQDWLCPLRKEMGYILESKLREEEQCTTMRVSGSLLRVVYSRSPVPLKQRHTMPAGVSRYFRLIIQLCQYGSQFIETRCVNFNGEAIGPRQLSSGPGFNSTRTS